MRNKRVKYALKTKMRNKRVKYAFIDKTPLHMHNKIITKRWEISLAVENFNPFQKTSSAKKYAFAWTS